MKHLKITFLFLLTSALAHAGAGYQIKGQIDNFEGKELYLAHYLGDKVYIDDTTTVQSNGHFVFEGSEPLPAGMYVLVIPPDNKFVELLVTEEEQQFSLQLDATRLTEDVIFRNARDNALFYDYIHFMQEKRRTYEELKQQAEELAARRQKNIEADIQQYRQQVIREYPNTLTATIIKSQLDVEPPAFNGDAEEVQFKSFYYRKKHFFDSVKEDKRFFKSRIFFDMATFYTDKMTPQHPDSINHSIDHVLNIVEADSLAFRFYFVHFMNKYAKSKYVGMDAVYVHMVDRYTRAGRTDFISVEEREKMLDNATRWAPILVGKTAPEIELYELDVPGTLERKEAEKEMDRFALAGPTSLHGVIADFTVLVFWHPDCGYCKKAMPKIVDFYEQYRDRGVEVFAVCDEYYKGIPACAEALQNYGALKWINAVDPLLRSKYKQKFDVQSTPMIYVLDERKEIVLKKIGAEQLSQLMDELLKEKK